MDDDDDDLEILGEIIPLDRFPLWVSISLIVTCLLVLWLS
jgi:hypothetical protein